MALLTSLAIGAGTGIASLLANRAVNKRPDLPDFTSEVSRRYADRARRLRATLEGRADALEGDLAARGATGSAGVADREALYRQGNNAMISLAAREADAVAAAENEEERLRYQRDRAAYEGRAQAISDLFGGIGSTLSAEYLGRKHNINPMQVDRMMDPEDASVPMPSWRNTQWLDQARQYATAPATFR